MTLHTESIFFAQALSFVCEDGYAHVLDHSKRAIDGRRGDTYVRQHLAEAPGKTLPILSSILTRTEKTLNTAARYSLDPLDAQKTEFVVTCGADAKFTGLEESARAARRVRVSARASSGRFTECTQRCLRVVGCPSKRYARVRARTRA